MEGSEIPKGELTNPGHSLENKELSIKAAELAKATREKGMGVLMGKFSPRFFPKHPSFVGGFSYIGKFIQNEEIPFNTPGEGAGLINWHDIPNQGRSEQSRINYLHRQRWMKSKYMPRMKVVKEQQIEERPRKVKFLGGLITKTYIDRKSVTVRKPTNIPITYHGKKGEGDWIQYDYRMIIEYPYDTRSGTFVNMSVAVPPDIANQIDDQVAKNIYFPDAFFKALYPGYIGPDAKQDVKRIQATELEVIDLLGKPPKSEIRKYPQPIPY